MEFEVAEVLSKLEGRMKRLRQFLEMEDKQLTLTEIITIREYLNEILEIVHR